MHFALYACILTVTSLVSSALGDPSYGYAYQPPARFESACNQCKPTVHCKSELEIRDSTIPKEVPIPYIDYQIVFKDKPVQVVTDFDVQERPCPIPVQLQDQRINLQPVPRTVEKVVVVRVPRVTENIVIKKLDRIKVVTETRRKPKLVRVQHVRQVPQEERITVPRDVVRKKLVAQTTQVPVPVRIANQVHVDVQNVDKPVQVPSIQYKFCETIQEIKVKGDCPPSPTKPPGYLPPGSE